MCADLATAPGHTAAQRLMLRAIRFYQTAREGRPSPCRFWPTCSHYGYEAIETHGAARGLWLTVRRLSRCRPFGSSGVDPVPDPRPGR
jgi:putative membrane protein insertion efficiency factor